MQTPSRAFQALHEVAVAAAGLHDPVELATLVVDRARDLLNSAAAALYWYDAEQDLLVTLAQNDPLEGTPEPPFRPGDGAAGQAFSSGVPVAISEYSNWTGAKEWALAQGIISGMAVPLVVADRGVGALGVFTRTAREWSRDDESLLVLFAAQVAPALEAARLAAETVAQARTFRLLHELAVAAGELHDAPALAQLVCEAGRDLLKADTVLLRMWDAEAEELQLAGLDDDQPASVPFAVPSGHGVVGLAFANREPVVNHFYQEDPKMPSWQVERGVRSASAVPLMVRDRAVGAIGAGYFHGRQLTENEVRIMVLLAAQVAPALEGARLYSATERRRVEAEALAELVRRGASHDDIQTIIALVTEQATRLLEADYAYVVLDAPGGGFALHGLHGGISGHAEMTVQPAADHPGVAVRGGATVVLENLDDRERYPAEQHPFHSAERGVTALATPLQTGGRQRGALVVGWRRRLRPSSRQLRLAEALAGYAATILESVRAREQERELGARAAAREAELSAVIQQIPSGVYVAGGDGSITLMNQAALRMLELEAMVPGEIDLAQSPIIVSDPQTGRRLEPQELAVARALAGERIENEETVLNHSGWPAEKLFTISAVPLRDAHAELTGAVVVFSDITRERRLVMDLADSEQRFRSLYGMVSCGVLVQDAEGRVLDANERAEEIVGWSLEEMRAKPIGSLWQAVTEDGMPLPLDQRPTMRAVQTRRTIRNLVMGVVQRSGETHWLQIDTVPVLDEKGNPVQVVSSFIDITERKRAEQQLAASETKYRLLFDDNPEAMWVFDAATRAFLAVNRMAVERYGYSRAEFLALRLEDIRPPEDREQFVAGYTAEANEVLTATYSGIWRHYRRDGTIFWAQGSSHAIEFDGRPARLGMAADITDRKLAEDRLQASESQLRAIFDQAPIGLSRVSLDGMVLESNQVLQDMLGYTAEELSRLAFTALIGTPTLEADENTLAEFVNGTRETYQAERAILRKGGGELWGAVSASLVRGPGGEPLYLIGMISDISERKAQTELLEYQALHDALTDLPNRTLLNDRLQQAVLTAHRGSSQVALLLMDLNRFKDVNDTFGHHLGDVLLQQVGPRIRSLLRESDTVARLGGDEFAVVLPTAGDEEGARLAADRILKALEEPFAIGERVLEIGGSIGIAICPQHGLDPATLMRRADIAMYVAKRGGLGYSLYSPEHDQHSPGRLALTAELRQAVERGQLVLHWQPQVDTRRNRLAGVEALVRWNHPRHGLMVPERFLQLAEETGQVGALSQWALGAALAQSHAWSARGLCVPVAVNLSMQNLHDPTLPEQVAALLSRWGVSARSLKIEITETAVMADPARSLETLSSLRQLGVYISIDDFGTGYSSLSQLKQMPVDEIKIDRSFVVGITRGSEEIAIVRSMIDLGHSLDLIVVAEGAEDALAVEIVTELECDLIQGFHLARPMPARQVSRWLNSSAFAKPEPTVAG